MDMDAILSIAPFEWHSIGTAILCGSIIGVERQLRGKPVGIRTSSLITLGSYIFIAASLYVSAHMAGPEKVVTDPSRIIGQVITGIGFLGAGVMLARDGFVLGVTSAATIWMPPVFGTAQTTMRRLRCPLSPRSTGKRRSTPRR